MHHAQHEAATFPLLFVGLEDANLTCRYTYQVHERAVPRGHQVLLGHNDQRRLTNFRCNGCSTVGLTESGRGLKHMILTRQKQGHTLFDQVGLFLRTRRLFAIDCSTRVLYTVVFHAYRYTPSWHMEHVALSDGH